MTLCLAFLTCLLIGVATAWLTGDLCFGFLLGSTTSGLGVVVLIQAADCRIRQRLGAWAAEQSLTVVAVHRRDGKITPATVSFWRDWDSWELQARDNQGLELTYYFFPTGVFFCLLDVRLHVSTPDDYHRIVWCNREVE